MVQSEWGVNCRFSDLLPPGSKGRGPGVMALSVGIRSRTAVLQPLEEYIDTRQSSVGIDSTAQSRLFRWTLPQQINAIDEDGRCSITQPRIVVLQLQQVDLRDPKINPKVRQRLGQTLTQLGRVGAARERQELKIDRLSVLKEIGVAFFLWPRQERLFAAGAADADGPALVGEGWGIRTEQRTGDWTCCIKPSSWR